MRSLRAWRSSKVSARQWYEAVTRPGIITLGASPPPVMMPETTHRRRVVERAAFTHDDEPLRSFPSRLRKARRAERHPRTHRRRPRPEPRDQRRRRPPAPEPLPGPELHDPTPTGPYRYHGGVNLAGVAAQLLGTGAAVLCLNSLYVGPVASALGGADLSAVFGPLVAGLTYVLLFRALYCPQLDRVRLAGRRD